MELNSYIGTQWLGDHYDLVANSAEHMTMANQAMTNNGSSKLFPETLIANFANGMDSYKYPNTDWYDASFENALITGHNLSIRSGTEKLSAFTSLSYLKQDGIMIGSDAARYGIRSNLDYKVNSWLKIGGRFSYTKRKAKEPFNLEAVHRQIKWSDTIYCSIYSRWTFWICTSVG